MKGNRTPRVKLWSNISFTGGGVKGRVVGSRPGHSLGELGGKVKEKREKGWVVVRRVLGVG